MRKPVRLALAAILISACLGLRGQTLCPPQIEWQQSYGTPETESLTVAKPRAAGGFLLAGSRYVPGRGDDFYVVRIDAAGHIVGEATFGGSGSDILTAAAETSDGGLVLAGWSGSSTGSGKTAPNYGALDFWVVRLDASGNKLWDRSYGGTAWDELYSIVPAADGGFLLGGYSSSLPGSGNKSSANYGNYDYWVVRIDEHGNQLWQQSYGGSEPDYLLAMAASTNGFLLAGGSASPAGPNKTGTNYGGYDIWAVRIDANGHTLWDASFGGGFSEFCRAVVALEDGGFLLGSPSSSPPAGNKTAQLLGDNDFWVVRINGAGARLWDQSYGGTGEDTLYGLAAIADGGFLATGRSSSPPGGTKTSPGHGEIDCWVVRLGPTGQQLWDQSFGGRSADFGTAAGQTPNSGFFVAGTSWSEPGGNKTAPRIGNSDFWFLQLRPETPGDCDGDGVSDEHDLCPATPSGALIDARGCTIDQSCPCQFSWRNASDYVNCVRHVTSDFLRAGLITPAQRDILLAQAQATNCPPPLPPPDAVIAFGFTNIALGGATLTTSTREGSGSSVSYDIPAFASDLTFDGSRGMAVLLGEADSGMFFYPDAPVEWGSYDPANFMLGKAFGRMEGVENLLLGAMQARKTYYEVYPVEIDLSPLEPTSLTLQVFSRGELQSQLQVTGATTRVVVQSSVTVGPRANPFWRMPDGSVGALIEFTDLSAVGEWGRFEIVLPGIEDAVFGDRIFIRADNPLHQVDFVSRFEVYGGGGLPSFWMIDGRIGMFNLPHRISGPSVFSASGGTLTVENIQPDASLDHGAIIELNGADLFDASLEPLVLSSNEYFALYLTVAAEELGSDGPYIYHATATTALSHQGSQVELSANSTALPVTNVLVRVFKHGSLAGQALAPPNLIGTFPVRGNDAGPRLAGLSAALSGPNRTPIVTLAFDRLHTFRTASGLELRGNLVQLELQSSLTLETLATAALRTTHPSFTITGERLRLEPPRLGIVAAGAEATVSWKLQNQPFALESAPAVNGPFTLVTNEPALLDGTATLTLPLDAASNRFFRLRLNDQ